MTFSQRIRSATAVSIRFSIFKYFSWAMVVLTQRFIHKKAGQAPPPTGVIECLICLLLFRLFNFYSVLFTIFSVQSRFEEKKRHSLIPLVVYPPKQRALHDHLGPVVAGVGHGTRPLQQFIALCTFEKISYVSSENRRKGLTKEFKSKKLRWNQVISAEFHLWKAVFWAAAFPKCQIRPFILVYPCRA